MTNLPGTIKKTVGNTYGLRTWIEYGFKQSKNELGWADFRLTAFQDIEKWWEIVCSAYLMVRLQSSVFKESKSGPHKTTRLTSQEEEQERQTIQEQFAQHKWWDRGTGWKKSVLSQVFIHDPLRYDLLLLSRVNSEGER